MNVNNQKQIRLIINADDYGYYKCVSRGILDTMKSGNVTATGVMANSQYFMEAIKELLAIETADAGIHLNLTFGKPLTNSMKNDLERWNGNFPPKYKLVTAILKGEIRKKSVFDELSAQIERCIDAGLAVTFLNSHEHVHMLPVLYPMVLELSDIYRIPYVRYTDAEWMGKINTGYLIRNIIFTVLGWVNSRDAIKSLPKLIGTGESGKLSINYLEKRLSSLKNDRVYELMCHPGYFDKTEIDNAALVSYHDWESELSILMSEHLNNVFERCNVRLIGYRDIL